MQNDIGIIGLGTMGQNLALNCTEKGFSVAVFNRTFEKTQEFLAQNANNALQGFSAMPELVSSLKSPRIILMMIPAGEGIDHLIDELLPLLSSNDVLIDGGNSYFKDTQNRLQVCEEKGILYVGAGISGGQKGARYGPSIMPGGSQKAWELIKPLFQAISAKTQNGSPCCEWIGPDGSGHYIKMVHNAIEYALMQLIAETYWLAKQICEMTNSEIAQLFGKYNEGKLNSYLLEITEKILVKKATDAQVELVDTILDKPQQKGTGKWTVQNALDIGVSIPTLSESVFARITNSLKDERVKASKKYEKPDSTLSEDEKAQIQSSLESALYTAQIIAFSQGFGLLKYASDEYKWSLDYAEIASIWKEGCIIRSKLLEPIMNAYEKEKDLNHLIVSDVFIDELTKSLPDLRKVSIAAIQYHVAVPTLSSALQFFDAITSTNSPANIIQAQRDFFGSHMYELVEKEGTFHTQWEV